MVLCPVALAVGCKKCPVFAVCPAKSLIGDYKPDGDKRKDEARSAAKKKRAQK
jgi:hypothetical protein